MDSLFTVFTKERASFRAKLRNLEPEGTIIAVMQLDLDNTNIAIHFESADRFIEFCERHNISYTDARTSTSARNEGAAPGNTTCHSLGDPPVGGC